MALFSLFRPLLFLLEPETAHRATITALKLMPQLAAASPDPILSTQVAGLAFPSPVGLAAGFDKDAEVPLAVLALGFGSAEVGTLTPEPQRGNPRPRLFRLAEEHAVINRMGFNNGGQAAARARLTRFRGKGIIGINVGANKDAADRIADYATGVAAMAGLADYLTINISSPNTPGLRALQDEGALAALMDAITAARPAKGPPIFLKVAPDLEPADIDAIARLSIGKVDGLIIANTTISRPALSSRHAGETGGLSGAPLCSLAQQRLVDFRKAVGGAMPLIAAGGISTADHAYARIRAGASLVQVYSAMVYKGPGLARRINTGLAALLRRDGFGSVGEAVGADYR